MSGDLAPAGERHAFLHAEASSWLQWDPNVITKAAVKAAVETNDLPTLEVGTICTHHMFCLICGTSV